MFDNTDNEVFAVLVALSLFVFFAGMAWAKLAHTVPSWLHVTIGISALILAVSALLALF